MRPCRRLRRPEVDRCELFGILARIALSLYSRLWGELYKPKAVGTAGLQCPMKLRADLFPMLFLCRPLAVGCTLKPASDDPFSNLDYTAGLGFWRIPGHVMWRDKGASSQISDSVTMSMSCKAPPFARHFSFSRYRCLKNGGLLGDFSIPLFVLDLS